MSQDQNQVITYSSQSQETDITVSKISYWRVPRPLQEIKDPIDKTFGILEKTSVRSGIRTHVYMCRLRPERSALDRSAILTS